MLIAGLRVLPETPRRPGRFDLAGAVLATLGPAAGAVLATLGPAAVAYGFVRAAEYGWAHLPTVGLLAGGAALLRALVAVERGATQRRRLRRRRHHERRRDRHHPAGRSRVISRLTVAARPGPGRGGPVTP